MKTFLLSSTVLLLSTGMVHAQTVDEIIVTGHGAYPLPKIDQPILDTPQSISIVTPEELNEQAVTSLHEALLDVPEAQAHADEDSQAGDNFYIRGFSAENDIYIDGIRNPGRYKQDSFNMQSLEVLSGPSGATFGRGSTGGVINFITKTPQLEPITGGTFMLGTDDTKRLTGDLDMPIGPDAAFRVNFVGHDAGFYQPRCRRIQPLRHCPGGIVWNRDRHASDVQTPASERVRCSRLRSSVDLFAGQCKAILYVQNSTAASAAISHASTPISGQYSRSTISPIG